MGGDVVMNTLAITQVIEAIIASIQNSNGLTEVCFHRMVFIVADESVAYYYLETSAKVFLHLKATIDNQ